MSFDVPQETWDKGDVLSDATSDDDKKEDDENDYEQRKEEELRSRPEPEKWNTTFLHDYFT